MRSSIYTLVARRHLRQRACQVILHVSHFYTLIPIAEGGFVAGWELVT